MNYHKLIEKESAAFDRQAEERIQHGFVPDLRNLKKVDWFYNNVWRDPEFVKIHWMPRINNIVDQARVNKGRVLEVGCGYGMLSLELARNGLQVLGVDVSQKSIEIANRFKDKNTYVENFGSLEYQCEDFLRLELEEASFETVIFFRSLHHFADINKLMKKVHRVLKRGGKLLFSEPVRADFTWQSAQVSAVLRMVLPTWESYAEKLNGEWGKSKWETNVSEIFNEYTYEEGHEQSPMDNSTNESQQLISSIKELFLIKELSYSDAFADKLIGGLRGDNKYELAKFIKFLDNYMVSEKILPPTSVEAFAEKK